MLFGRRERKPGTDGGRSTRGLWYKWLIRKCFPAHQLKRLRASPHEVALGCAVGVFISITPLLGAQMLIAALIAGLLRASVPAAVLGTFFGNPVSWPIIWTSTYAMGVQIVRLDWVLDAGDFEQNVMLLWAALLERSPELLNATIALLWPLLLPMLAGSLPLGPADGRHFLLYFEELDPRVAGPSYVSGARYLRITLPRMVILPV